jgi:hypothetical protein
VASAAPAGHAVPGLLQHSSLAAIPGVRGAEFFARSTGPGFRAGVSRPSDEATLRSFADLAACKLEKS